MSGEGFLRFCFELMRVPVKLRFGVLSIQLVRPGDAVRAIFYRASRRVQRFSISTRF
jgi:hypothetical protein